MISTDPSYAAVVAEVATSAMPEQFRSWAGGVIVEGTCTTRVVGFAEVSRVGGEPPGAYDTETGEYDENARWKVADVVEDNVTLAARLEDCSGSWARADSYPAVALAEEIEEPAVAAAARNELLARRADDPAQKEWIDSRGEGDWRAAVDVKTQIYRHPLTDETWVIAQATAGGGGCGEPAVSRMAVYRASESGKLRRVGDLEYATSTIQDVVDLDGDGQPEIVFGDGEGKQLVDLMGQSHDGISLSYDYTGCGC